LYINVVFYIFLNTQKHPIFKEKKDLQPNFKSFENFSINMDYYIKITILSLKNNY